MDITPDCYRLRLLRTCVRHDRGKAPLLSNPEIMGEGSEDHAESVVTSFENRSLIDLSSVSAVNGLGRNSSATSSSSSRLGGVRPLMQITGNPGWSNRIWRIASNESRPGIMRS